MGICPRDRGPGGDLSYGLWSWCGFVLGIVVQVRICPRDCGPGGYLS